ncbi:hypothetical protein FIE12Z_4374 [Fusarium flagelliforme]|uniref:Hydrophobin n=1 Tax=Fusarium flagelliforme TaxID=2675880 RepID=A0A395MU92_9HYPO|nr:hypothetical protein FIE12Z_4374 [Fusarium flagelliforme]
MKASIILTLPVLALAAATPAKVEERQVDPLTCLNGIPRLLSCIDTTGAINDPSDLLDGGLIPLSLLLCLPRTVLTTVLGCLSGLPLPVKE